MAKKSKKSNKKKTSTKRRTNDLYIDGPKGKYLVINDDNYNALTSIPEVSAYWKELPQFEEEADEDQENLETLLALIKWAVSQGCAGVSVNNQFYRLPENET